MKYTHNGHVQGNCTSEAGNVRCYTIGRERAVPDKITTLFVQILMKNPPVLQQEVRMYTFINNNTAARERSLDDNYE